MSNVHPIRPHVKPLSTNSVRLVGAWLRCAGCQFEWRGTLNEWSEVCAESLRCPRCAEQAASQLSK